MTVENSTHSKLIIPKQKKQKNNHQTQLSWSKLVAVVTTLWYKKVFVITRIYGAHYIDLGRIKGYVEPKVVLKTTRLAIWISINSFPHSFTKSFTPEIGSSTCALHFDKMLHHSKFYMSCNTNAFLIYFSSMQHFISQWFD